MDLSYFEYISKTKVEMLEAQLAKRRFMRGLAAKISLFGVTAEVSAENEADESLVRRALSLVQALDRRSLIYSIGEEEELDTTKFYQDQSTWAHGLFSFSGDIGGFRADGGGWDRSEASLISYFVWRRWRDSIILLAGSPLNVLGESQICGDARAPGTSSTWNSVKRFAKHVFPRDADERPYIQTTSAEARQRHSETDWVDWRPRTHGLMAEPLRSPLLPPSWAHVPRSVELGFLCTALLNELPRTTIRLTFRILEKLDVPSMENHAALITREFDESADNQSWKGELGACRSLYIGSPIAVSL